MSKSPLRVTQTHLHHFCPMRCVLASLVTRRSHQENPCPTLHVLPEVPLTSTLHLKRMVHPSLAFQILAEPCLVHQPCRKHLASTMSPFNSTAAQNTPS